MLSVDNYMPEFTPSISFPVSGTGGFRDIDPVTNTEYPSSIKKEAYSHRPHGCRKPGGGLGQQAIIGGAKPLQASIDVDHP